MSALLMVAVVVVLVCALAYLIGARLPARLTTRLRATVQRPAGAIWITLMDYERHPMANRYVRRVEPRPAENGLPSWLEDLGATRILVRTVRQEVPHRLVREMVDQVLPVQASVEFLLVDMPGGCLIQIQHETQIPSGTWYAPILRLLIRAQKSPEANLRHFLTRLAGELGTRPHWE